MAHSSNTHASEIDIHELLNQRRQIAVFWSVNDVQQLRPDLTEDQAWGVLQECDRQQDCEVGITWDLLGCLADELFPQSEDPLAEQGDRS